MLSSVDFASYVFVGCRSVAWSVMISFCSILFVYHFSSVLSIKVCVRSCLLHLVIFYVLYIVCMDCIMSCQLCTSSVVYHFS